MAKVKPREMALRKPYNMKICNTILKTPKPKLTAFPQNKSIFRLKVNSQNKRLKQYMHGRKNGGVKLLIITVLLKIGTISREFYNH